MAPLQAVALVLAYVAQSDGVLAPEERDAIADVIPELVPEATAHEIRDTVGPLLASGNRVELVAKACLTLTTLPLELRLATLRSALIVARSHERMSPEERVRLAHLARDLDLPLADVERMLPRP